MYKCNFADYDYLTSYFKLVTPSSIFRFIFFIHFGNSFHEKRLKQLILFAWKVHVFPILPNHQGNVQLWNTQQ